MSADDGRSSSDESSARVDGSSTSAKPLRRADVSKGSDDLWTRFRTANDGPLMVVREILVSGGSVLAVGLLLFAVSGVWPPMVAVESGSMDPHMQRGDLVFITEPGRFAPDAAHGDTGVVTVNDGRSAGYRTFGGYGSVVVYDNPNQGGPPVIHRAHFWVAEGENWYGKANPAYVNADNCAALNNCPAPHAGFITKGDANDHYDQAYSVAISGPVKPAWIEGVSRVRIPYLGYVRLWLTGAAAPPATVSFATVELFDAAVHGPGGTPASPATAANVPAATASASAA